MRNHMNRVQHSREDLIKLIKQYLEQPIAAKFFVCRAGLEDALVELEKPVLPDNAQLLIEDALARVNIQERRFADIAYDIYQALLPKPKMKTIWRVALPRGAGWTICNTEAQAFDVARDLWARGEIVRADKLEVAA